MFAHEFMRNALLAGTLRRARLRPRRLLRRAARPGVRGRRAQPRRVHRRARRRRARARHPRGPLRRHDPRRLVMGAARRPRPRRRRRDRHRVRLDARPRRALPLDLHHASSSAGNGTAGVRVLFGSIFGLSARRRPRLASLLAVARGRRSCSRSPGRCCSPRSTPASPRPRACRCARSGSRSSRSSASSRPRRPRPSARCSCSGLLAAPAGAAHRLTANPYAGLAASARARGRLDLDRPDAQLRDPRAAAQLGDRVRGRGRLRRGRWWPPEGRVTVGARA